MFYFLICDGPPAEPKRHGHGPDVPERDPGCKSEGEDESLQGAAAVILPPVPTCKKSLGKTPNHLTLR